MCPGTATLWEIWLIASMGTPAAIRPITGSSLACTESEIGRGFTSSLLAGFLVETRLSLVTLLFVSSESGSLTISMARAL